MARKFLSGIDVVSQKIVNLADGTNPSDAVNKAQLDSALAGQSWKQPVKAATTANGALASAYANGQTVDGVVLATNDRILIKDQTDAKENGIYKVNASGAPTRATDADTTAELQSATVLVIAGTVNKDRAYTQTTDDPTVGTSDIVFAQVGGGVAYLAGNGLSLTGTTFAVVPKPGGGLTVDGSGVAIDSTYSGLAKRYSTDVPNGSTSAVITHGLGTLDVHVQVREVSTGAVVEPDITVTSTTQVTLGFAVAPTTGQYRVTVIG
jgi:hypothetical protein